MDRTAPPPSPVETPPSATGLFAFERPDLEALALSCAVVPVVWFALLDWDPSKSIGLHDHVAQNVQIMHDLVEGAQGDWRRMTYRAELEGGAQIHDVMGTLPLLQLFGMLGMSTLNAANGVLLCTQIACAFFGLRLAYDVGQRLTGKPVSPEWLSRIAIVLLAAFSPTLAWKMTTGHHEEVFGALVGISLVSLFLAYRNKTSSLTLLAMTVAVQLQGFQTKGQELVYGVVFFGLVVVAAAMPLRPSKKLLVPALATVGSLCLSLPKLAGMLAHARSSDAGRGFGSGSVIYSYVTGTLHDWVSSVPWGATEIPLGRTVDYWHETNFGFGPPLALALLLPWKKGRWLAAGLVTSLLLPILFSMNVPGVAWVLTHLFPPLNAFRVPERAVLAFALILPPVAAAALLVRPTSSHASVWVVPLTATVVGLALFFAPEGLREVLAWGVPLALLLRPVFRWTLPARLPVGVLLIGLGCASVSAFKERLRAYTTEESLIASPAKVGAQVRSAQPELESPLTRVLLHFDLDGYQTNTGYMMGVSTLDGYLNPPLRYVELEAALSGTELTPLRNYFRIDESVPSLRVLQPLYNVKYVAVPETQKLRVAPLPPTAGPAWFSTAFVRVNSMGDLAHDLKATQDTLATEAHRRAWVVSSDDAVQTANLPADVPAACKDAEVKKVEATFGSPTFRVQVDSPADCPLTIATNFATDLVATTDGRPVPLFPSYGSLAALIVPEGTHDVVLTAPPIVPPWSRVGWAVGLGLVGFAAWLMGKRCKEEARARAACRADGPSPDLAAEEPG